MKHPKLPFILLLMAMSALPSGDGWSEGFHNGATGPCDGCHTDPPRLRGSDPSSTCLICHHAPAGTLLPVGHYVGSDPRTLQLCSQLPPGGDFCWLKKDYRWSSSEEAIPAQSHLSLGERHGHNIVAADFGYAADSRFVTSPGGVYPAAALSCISCHDPHGNYRRTSDGNIVNTGPAIVASGSYPDSPSPDDGNSVGVYRLLGGKGYRPSRSAVEPFTADPPTAVAPSPYNRAETVTETRVAYGSGMSEWCANCHAGIHSDNYPVTGMHPSGGAARLSAEIINNYNGYLMTGNITNSEGGSYSSLVPFEMGTRDYTVLKAAADNKGVSTSGPQSGSNVMCLTCHRAHASGWDSMTRWNMDVDFLVYQGTFPGVDKGAPLLLAQGRTEAETRKSYYDRSADTFAAFQRSLCNKCHLKD